MLHRVDVNTIAGAPFATYGSINEFLTNRFTLSVFLLNRGHRMDCRSAKQTKHEIILHKHDAALEMSQGGECFGFCSIPCFPEQILCLTCRHNTLIAAQQCNAISACWPQQACA